MAASYVRRAPPSVLIVLLKISVMPPIRLGARWRSIRAPSHSKLCNISSAALSAQQTRRTAPRRSSTGSLPLFGGSPRHVLGSHLCRIVIVIFVGRHRFVVVKGPRPLFRRQLVEHAGHLANVSSDSPAAGTDVVHSDVSRPLCIGCHLFAAELQGVQLEGEFGKAGEIGFVRGRAV